MKKLLLVLLTIVPATGWAFDFSVTLPGGQTIYLDTVPGGVTVVFPNEGGVNQTCWQGYTRPTGALTIPSSVQYQGVSYPVLSIGASAFYGCASLTSLTVESGVASIGSRAFYFCDYLISITLPSTLTSIDALAFANCMDLQEVTLYCATPPTTQSTAFSNSPIASCTLHVPCGSGTAYGAATLWSQFGTIATMQCAVNVTLGVNNPARGSVSGAGSYAPGTVVTLTATPSEGYGFVCWSDGDTLNPRLVSLTTDLNLTAIFMLPIHDTVTLHEVELVHDTVTRHDTVTVHDTVTLHDSLTVHDTITLTPTYFQLEVLSDNEALGLGVGSATLPAGTEVEICALPLEGNRFAGWNDGVTANPRRLTLTSATTLTAYFSHLGIEETAPRWSLAVDGRRLRIEGANGLPVSLYDAAGRLISRLVITGGTVFFDLPAAGVYLVQVGQSGARKVTVE